jgi:hypothetical protein
MPMVEGVCGHGYTGGVLPTGPATLGPAMAA